MVTEVKTDLTRSLVTLVSIESLILASLYRPLRQENYLMNDELLWGCEFLAPRELKLGVRIGRYSETNVQNVAVVSCVKTKLSPGLELMRELERSVSIQRQLNESRLEQALDPLMNQSYQVDKLRALTVTDVDTLSRLEEEEALLSSLDVCTAELRLRLLYVKSRSYSM